MKLLTLSGVLLLIASITASACAQQPAPTQSSAVSSAITIASGPSPVYKDGRCQFRLKMAANQRYVDRGYTFYGDKDDPVGWGFGFGCKAGASQDDIYDQIGTKLVAGKWIDLDFDEPFKPKQKFKLIEFAGKNWKGLGTAVDQIYYADADRRSRFFNFCLVENDGPQALCGRTQIRGVTEPDSASKLPKIMAVLKTIEFVDDPADTPAPAPSAAH